MQILFPPQIGRRAGLLMWPRPGASRPLLMISGVRRLAIFSPPASDFRAEVTFLLARSFDRSVTFFLDLPSGHLFVGLKVGQTEGGIDEVIAGVARRGRVEGTTPLRGFFSRVDALEAEAIGPASEIVVGPLRPYRMVLSGDEWGFQATLDEEGGSILWETRTPWVGSESREAVRFGLTASPSQVQALHVIAFTVGRRG
jgi:hypothetical protein